MWVRAERKAFGWQWQVYWTFQRCDLCFSLLSSHFHWAEGERNQFIPMPLKTNQSKLKSAKFSPHLPSFVTLNSVYHGTIQCNDNMLAAAQTSLKTLRENPQVVPWAISDETLLSRAWLCSLEFWTCFVGFCPYFVNVALWFAYIYFMAEHLPFCLCMWSVVQSVLLLAPSLDLLDMNYSKPQCSKCNMFCQKILLLWKESVVLLKYTAISPNLCLSSPM